jgi:hypothetical protein
LYDQPGGIAGPSIFMPIGMMRPKAISRAPTSVSFAYAAAPGDQKTSGADSTHKPTSEMSQETSPRCGLSAARDMPSAIIPLTTSLHMSARLS